MVMASGPGRRPSAAHSPFEVAREAGGDEETEAGALHDRLVSYVHALDRAHDPRCGVWGEHSYARAGLAAAGGAVRVLLAPRLAPDAALDVQRPDPPPPRPPRLPSDGDDDDDADDADADDDEWEARLAGLAPSAEHARLAAGVAESLRRVRLARLAGGAAAGAFARRAEARALRRALAPLWLARAPPPPQWLHAALAACAPPHACREYGRLVAELRRAAPRLAERLTTGARPSVPPATRSAPGGVGPETGPWLAWLGGGRWARRLAPLVHTRRVRVAAPTAAPDAWCAAAAGAARAALADIIAEAGARPVVVGGAGGCARLAAALAGGARGLLALGARAWAGAEAGACGGGGGGVGGWRGAALVVAGGGAAVGWRGALAEALGARQRLLVVTGADDALRLPARHAARLRLDQRALDAHIAEECVRWIHEVCEAAEADDEAEAEAGRGAPRPATPHGAESEEEEEYAHLPAARVAAGAEADTRVVSRVAGGTPLALVPPRRASPRERRGRRASPPPAAPLAAADIMHMPIVFADDERPHEPAVTVRSGARAADGFKYTRVIVAKRGAGGGRPLLLRRGVRLVPREPR